MIYRWMIAAAIVLVLAAGCWSAASSPRVAHAQTPNAIQLENALPGTDSWRLAHPARHREIEGYAWSTSVAPGESITFSVSTAAPTYTADVYRMGWYGGAGGRLMQSVGPLLGHLWPTPAPDPVIGVIDCHWGPALTLSVPDSWVSGTYLVKLTSSTGLQAYIPFVVRSLDPQGTLLFVHAVNTDEAYNSWGGVSLYHDFTGTLPYHRALAVSFNRPFFDANHTDVGAGCFFCWEYDAVRWLERMGYPVSYVTDVDISENPQMLTQAAGILIVGHNEYWTKEMRDSIEAAVSAGVNLGVLGGNTGYWQVRYESSAGLPDRIMAGYRSALLDPITPQDPAEATVRFRDPPVNRPESMLLGAAYAGVDTGGVLEVTDEPAQPWVVSSAPAWLLASSGLRPGESVPGIVGYEYDTLSPNLPVPPGIQVIAASQVHDVGGESQTSYTTLYTAPSGARVFNAGTIGWAWGLDDYVLKGWTWIPPETGGNPGLQALTANLLDNFLSVSPASIPTVSAQVSGTLSEGNWYRSSPVVRLQTSSTTPDTAIEYRIGAQTTWNAYSGPFAIQSEGTVAIDYRAVLPNGESSPVGSTFLHIDSVPPTTQVTVGPWLLISDQYLPDFMTVAFQAADTGSGVAGTQYSLDGGITWLPYLHPLAVQVHGDLTILYRSVDYAGNVEVPQRVTLFYRPQGRPVLEE